MIVSVLAALSLMAQDPQVAPQTPPEEEPIQLESIEVTGRPLDQLIGEFVDEVGEPNRNRGLARWDGTVCVGVANLKTEAAQYLSDRVSTVAEDLGLRVGGPGCTPNILIVATNDGAGMARSLVERQGRAFRMGGAGMDRGGDALEDFQETDRPIRWWQLSLPVDADTGDRAVRLPGDCRNACTEAKDMAPQISVFSASRLRTQIVDNLFRTIVVVDVDEVSELSILQLADYIAMVSLAQVDPDADTMAYSSILNVFQAPDDSASLTAWDQAYLGGLYGAERNEANARAGRRDVIASIRRSHEELRDGEEDATPAE